MSEYTSLDLSKSLLDAGFNETSDDRYNDAGTIPTDAYRADTLLSWLLNHGDSIEITPDLDGFNCTFWINHQDYNGINIFLCDALAELILNVLEVKV